MLNLAQQAEILGGSVLTWKDVGVTVIVSLVLLAGIFVIFKPMLTMLKGLIENQMEAQKESAKTLSRVADSLENIGNQEKNTAAKIGNLQTALELDRTHRTQEIAQMQAAGQEFTKSASEIVGQMINQFLPALEAQQELGPTITSLKEAIDRLNETVDGMRQVSSKAEKEARSSRLQSEKNGKVLEQISDTLLLLVEKLEAKHAISSSTNDIVDNDLISPDTESADPNTTQSAVPDSGGPSTGGSTDSP